MIVKHIHLIAGQLQTVYVYLLYTEIVTCYQNLSVLSACLFCIRNLFLVNTYASIPLRKIMYCFSLLFSKYQLYSHS